MTQEQYSNLQKGDKVRKVGSKLIRIVYPSTHGWDAYKPYTNDSRFLEPSNMDSWEIA